MSLHCGLDVGKLGAQAYAVIETIYPTAIADWANLKNNSFVTESLEDIGTRQLGLFKDIHLLEPTMIPDTVDKVCGRCMRQPSWLNGHQSDNPKLPCKSACNTWLSTAKARATGANNDEEQMISDNMVHLSKTGDTQQ